jgi:hypothetical protein
MILDGTYDSSGLADITRLVISYLHESKYVIRAPLTMTISDAAYVRYGKKVHHYLRQAFILVTITPW